MRSLKLSVALFFAAALASLIVSGRIASTQGSGPSSYPNTPLTAAQSAAAASLTNQADKVSGTGVTVSGGGRGRGRRQLRIHVGAGRRRTPAGR